MDFFFLFFLFFFELGLKSEPGNPKKCYCRRKKLFSVTHVVYHNPTVYKIQDQAREDKKGTLYAKELQKVNEPESYCMKKVILEEKKIELEIIFTS